MLLRSDQPFQSGPPERNRGAEHSSISNQFDLAQESLSSENPYASPGIRPDFRELVPVIRDMITTVHSALSQSELSFDDYHELAFSALQKAGFLSGGYSPENFLTTYKILGKCQRWLPLADRLGELHCGLRGDSMRLSSTPLTEESREDGRNYIRLRLSLRNHFLDCKTPSPVTREKFLEDITAALQDISEISDHRREILQRRLQTELQGDVFVDPPVSRYYYSSPILSGLTNSLTHDLDGISAGSRFFGGEQINAAVEAIARGGQL